MGIIIYTTPVHETLVAELASSNTPLMQSGVDNKLNTYWAPTQADLPAWSFIVDLCPQDADAYNAGRGKASGSIATIGLWIGNYHTDFTSASIDVTQGHDTGIGFTDTLLGPEPLAHDGPLFVVDFDTPSTKRYIKVSGTSFTEVPQLNFFYLSKNTLNRTHEYRGSEKIPVFDNTEVKVQGPNDHVTVHQTKPVYAYKRMYKLINATEVAWVDTVFTESSGRRNLFILNEGSGQVDNFLCRFNKDKPRWRDITADYREATLEFTTIHYVRDGEVI